MSTSSLWCTFWGAARVAETVDLAGSGMQLRWCSGGVQVSLALQDMVDHMLETLDARLRASDVQTLSRSSAPGSRARQPGPEPLLPAPALTAAGT